MEPVLRQSIVSLVVVYCVVAVLLLGNWVTEAFIGAPESSNLVGLGSSVTNALGFSSSQSTTYDVPTSGRSKTLSTARSISSLNDEEEFKEIDVRDHFPITALDISEAELQTLQGSLPQLYHSPRVFALNYEKMIKKMRIYIYPSESRTKYEYIVDRADESEEIRSTASYFFQNLADSEFVTENPERAQLFLLSVDVDSAYIELGPTKVAAELRRYVQDVRVHHPFWDQSLGADHFYMSCRAYSSDMHRNFLELTKNAIKVACSPFASNQYFFPHKDIVFPYYRPVNGQEVDSGFREKMQRTTLAYYSGPLNFDLAFATVLADDPDFDLDDRPTLDTLPNYKRLAASRFCVSISPQGTLNIVDALRLGCVPVVISKSAFHDLPFQDILNWYEFSVVVNIKDIAKLKDILTKIPVMKYRRMQYLGYQASKHMEWNTPPVAYDAFHMTLYELWLRRHTIKYARRTFKS